MFNFFSFYTKCVFDGSNTENGAEHSEKNKTCTPHRDLGELSIISSQRLFHYIIREYEAVAKNPIEGIYVTSSADSLLVWFGLLINPCRPSNLKNPFSIRFGWQRDRNHIYQVIIATQSIFFSCHCDSTQAANPEAAILLKENRKKFIQMAHDAVRRSRTQVYAQPNSEDPDAIRSELSQFSELPMPSLGRSDVTTTADNVDYIQIDDDEDEQVAHVPSSIFRTKLDLDMETNGDGMDVSLPPPEWFDDDVCASPQREPEASVPCTSACVTVHRKPRTKRKKKKAVEVQQNVMVEGEEEETSGADISDGEDLDTTLPVKRKGVAKSKRVAVLKKKAVAEENGGWSSDNELVILFETSPVVASSLTMSGWQQNNIKSELANGFEIRKPSMERLSPDIGLSLTVIEKYGVTSNANRRFMKAISNYRNKFLKGFNEFNKAIWTHLTTNLQNDHTFTWKMRVRTILHNQIRIAFPDSFLLAVGSTVNGCGAYNSDMDLCLGIPCPTENYGTTRSYAIKHLRKVKRILGSLDIMIFAQPYTNLEVDMNVNNIAGVYNSFLLHNYSRIDDRFPALCLLVKHWAKIKGISEASEGYLNSYSLILMVLHFLQCGVEPPVLPNLQHLYPDLFSCNRHFNDIKLFMTLPTPFPEMVQNTRTVGELLMAFFDYYNRFAFERFAISVRRGCIFSRSELASNTERFRLFVEEPFDQQNTARCVTNAEQWMAILNTFGEAAKALSPSSKCAPDLLKIGVRTLFPC
uniref:PAP-associated domain-containing protein n=1 Tax=Globodera rostochiensis TaxID=31243 RepID=A0A914H4H2_GLORO